jgi:hypothetical protein
MKSKRNIDSTRFEKIVVSVPRPKSILLPFEVKEDRRENTTGPFLISLRSSSVAPSVIELTSIPLECRPDKLELTRNRVRFELDTSNMLVNPSLLSPKGDSLVSVINTEKPKWVSSNKANTTDLFSLLPLEVPGDFQNSSEEMLIIDTIIEMASPLDLHTSIQAASSNFDVPRVCFFLFSSSKSAARYIYIYFLDFVV